MFETLPMVEILTVVVAVQVGCCWWMWMRCRECCKKAEDAYAASLWLWQWAKDLKLDEYLKCASKATGCKPADPDWPPKDPGDFPGSIT